MKKSAIVICALISMWTAGPVLASTNLGPAPAETTAPLQAPAQKSVATGVRAGEAASYAAREKAANPQLADFKGGDSAGIYIGGSTLAIVLLIVLLVVLL